MLKGISGQFQELQELKSTEMHWYFHFQNTVFALESKSMFINVHVLWLGNLMKRQNLVQQDICANTILKWL
jgi:hypothetical protein